MIGPLQILPSSLENRLFLRSDLFAFETKKHCVYCVCVYFGIGKNVSCFWFQMYDLFLVSNLYLRDLSSFSAEPGHNMKGNLIDSIGGFFVERKG